MRDITVWAYDVGTNFWSSWNGNLSWWTGLGRLKVLIYLQCKSFAFVVWWTIRHISYVSHEMPHHTEIYSCAKEKIFPWCLAWEIQDLIWECKHMEELLAADKGLFGGLWTFWHLQHGQFTFMVSWTKQMNVIWCSKDPVGFIWSLERLGLRLVTCQHFAYVWSFDLTKRIILV